MKLKPVFYKTTSSLFLALSIAGLAQGNGIINPQLVHRFDTYNGIFVPPVWSEQRQLLLGVTREGGDAFVIQPFSFGEQSFVSGLVFQLGLDGTSTPFASQSLGRTGGKPLTTLLLDEDETEGKSWLFAGSTYAARNPGDATDQSASGTIFAVDENLQLQAWHADYPGYWRPFQLRGQLARDSQGNIYLPDGFGNDASNPRVNKLQRLTPAGTVESVVDFDDYLEAEGDGSYPAKGDLPYTQVWSQADDALYLASARAVSTGYTRPSTLQGFLYRISGVALRRATGVTADDIGILYRFTGTAANAGAPAASDSGLHSLVEDGDFLYGSSNRGIWRIQKSGLTDTATAEQTFAWVHEFTLDETAERSITLAEGAQGSQAHGPLVKAADGYIYGTTLVDDSLVKPRNAAQTQFRAAGGGSIFRIQPGQATDRSDDQLVFVYLFAAEDAARPRGLSLGPVMQGDDGPREQVLIGAASSGGAAGNSCYTPPNTVTAYTSDCTGAGSIFTFTVPVLPGHVSLDSDADTSLAVGDEITLSWATQRVARCVASTSAAGVADWSGEQPVTAGSAPVTTLTRGSAVITAVAGTTDYILTCDALDGSSISDQVTLVIAGGDDGDNGNGDAGGSDDATDSDRQGGGGSGSSAGLGLLLLGLVAGWRRSLMLRR